MSRFSSSLTVGLSLVVFGATGVVLAAQSKCASSGLSTAGPGGTPALQCLGGCDGGAPCPPPTHSTTGHVVWGGYSFCACLGEGEATCCHLLFLDFVHTSVGESGGHLRFVSEGNCKQAEDICPPGVACNTSGTGSAVDPFEPACAAMADPQHP